MTRIKKLRIAVAVLLFGPCVAIIGEVGFFFWMLSSESMLEKSDLIVVFRGRTQRIPTGFQLAREGFAPNLVISPANNQYIKCLSSKYRQPQSVAIIIEDRARTTFENALYTHYIIKRSGYESVILVTSWHHMPRSYLLLKACLAGDNIQISQKSVPTGRLNRENWYKHLVAWKMLYNEILECWGSLIEGVQFKVFGELPAGQTGKSRFFLKVKYMLLFDIDPSDLAD